ncbi:MULTISPECIES: hypothetical protein [Halostella]|uniref:DUF7314 family protein n=1 Tax=Halostella TaxID=1843185 RepID=UPI0010801044|nr:MULTISPECIES: hypothetical protein [Halostella]
MADEFAKGFGILTSAGLIWMVLAGWFNTPTFEAKEYPQLLAPDPANPDTYTAIALELKDGLFWFAILGALTFWVVIPVGRELYAAYASE